MVIAGTAHQGEVDSLLHPPFIHDGRDGYHPNVFSHDMPPVADQATGRKWKRCYQF